MKKHLYIFSISMIFVSHIIQSAEVKRAPSPLPQPMQLTTEVKRAPSPQAMQLTDVAIPTPAEPPALPLPSTSPSLITRAKNCLATRCSRTALCITALIATAGLVTGLAIKYSEPASTTPPPMKCHDYSLAFSYACNNTCISGFSLDTMCVLPDEELQQTEDQLRAVCAGSQGLEISPYKLCSHKPQAPCRKWEPGIQKLNQSCNPLPITIDPLRNKYRQQLAVMAEKRKKR